MQPVQAASCEGEGFGIVQLVTSYTVLLELSTADVVY